MNHDETLCTICAQTYSQSNPPRLLTMCGHTFCDSCIKKLITRKKFNHKYKIVCPNDSQQIQLTSYHSTIFPINLSLLNLAKSKVMTSQNNLGHCRISIIETSGEQEPISAKNISILEENGIKKTEEDIPHENEDSFDDMPFDMCLLHQKPLEIVCMKDYKRICASCVIFGQHRGHKVKNHKEIEELIDKSKYQLQNIYNRYTGSYKQLEDDKVLKDLENKIYRKKIEVENNIHARFKQLSQLLSENQKRATHKADKHFNSLKLKCRELLLDKLNQQQHFSSWEQNLKGKIKILQDSHEEQKFKFLLREDNFIDNCKKIVEEVEQTLPALLQQMDTICDSITVVYDQKQAQNFFREVCKIQICENSFLDINQSKISLSKMEKEESLLDDIDTTELSLMMKSADYTDRIRKEMTNTIHADKNINIKEQKKMIPSRLKSTQSKQMRYYQSPKVTPRVSSRLISIDPKNPLGKSRTKIFKSIPEKYEKNLQQVLSGFSDVLDLTGAELGDQQLLNVLSSVKNSSLTIIKLVRNKLTDTGFEKIEHLISNSVMLNLSKNELTVKTLERILRGKREGRFVGLRSVMLGQNKIVERKCKVEVEGLQKLGVNICL